MGGGASAGRKEPELSMSRHSGVPPSRGWSKQPMSKHYEMGWRASAMGRERLGLWFLCPAPASSQHTDPFSDQ